MLNDLTKSLCYYSAGRIKTACHYEIVLLHSTTQHVFDTALINIINKDLTQFFSVELHPKKRKQVSIPKI